MDKLISLIIHAAIFAVGLLLIEQYEGLPDFVGCMIAWFAAVNYGESKD